MTNPDNAPVKSLRQLANRNIILSMILFAAMIGAILFAFDRAGKGLTELSELYDQQSRLEQFRSSMPNVLLPLNDYTLTQNQEDVGKIDKASQEFLRLYGEVTILPILTDVDNKELQEVFELMQEVIGIADDIVSGKIPTAMAGNVTVVAQSLVSVGQEKMEDVASRLEKAMTSETAAKIAEIEKLAVINIALIILVIIISALLSRSFVNSVSATISQVAKDVSYSSNEILGAVEQQANASDTQARSVSGVTMELEDMSESAKKIAKTASSV